MLNKRNKKNDLGSRLVIMLAGALALLVIQWAAPAHAADYWIDAVNGIDDPSRSGSETEPFKTIGYPDSLGLLLPGDTVHVKPGIYAPTTVKNCSGSATQPITYRAEGQAIIQGPGTGSGIGLLLQAASYLDVEGFEVRNCLYGIEYYFPAGGAGVAGTVRDCVVHDIGRRGLAIVSASGVNGTGGKFHRNLVYNVAVGLTALSGGVYVERHHGNIEILNNTIVMNSKGTSICGILIWGGDCASVVKNNIIMSTKYALDHNQAWGLCNNSHNLFYDNVTNYLYQVKREAGEFDADPLFVDPAQADYHLQDASPAIDAGIAVGLPYQGNAPDIGAFETNITVNPGYLSGVVTDVSNGNPLNRAVVMARGISATTDETGVYSLPLRPGIYDVTVTRSGFADGSASGVVVTEGHITTCNFALTRLPGRTFYVDPTGDDNNPGTETQPWLTINNGDVKKLLIPGDTVIVRPGTYSVTGYGAEFKNCFGDPGYPITIRGEQGAIVDGGNFGILVWLPNYIIEGFEVKNAVYYGIDLIIEAAGEVRNCLVHDCGYAGIRTDQVPCTIRNNVVYNITGGEGAISVSRGDGVKIYNNTIAGECTDQGCTGGPVGILASNCSNVDVRNNIIAGCAVGLNLDTSTGVHSNTLFYNNVPRNYGLLTSAGEAEFSAPPLLDLTYHLQAGSPAIDTGTDVGLPYSGAGPDLGAFESSFTGNYGTLGGTVRVNLTGTPALPGAQVAALGTSVSATTGQDGSYWMPLPPGTYDIECSAPGFQTATAQGVVISSGTHTVRNFTLEPGEWHTYYVDGLNGSDETGDGSARNPWATIDYADRQVTLLQPGDTVVVLPAVYYGPGGSGTYAVDIRYSHGAPLAPITYRADTTNGPVIIDGLPANATEWSDVGILVRANHIVLDGFEVTNAYIGVDFLNCIGGVGKNLEIHDTGFGAYSYGAVNLLYHNNLIYRQAAALPAMTLDNQLGGGRLLNNTVVGRADNIGIRCTGTGEAVVKNNIITDCATGLQMDNSNPVHSHNLFYQNGSNYAPGTVQGVAEQQNADPKFVGGGDYRLQSGSPAIDAGTNVGLPYNGLAPDLGAFESSYTGTLVSKSKIADLKSLPDGTWVQLTEEKCVMASAPGTFADDTYYIEEPDRTCGIKAYGGPVVALGDRITLTGVMDTDANGERMVIVQFLNSHVPDVPLGALAMNNRAIAGLDPTGLLVKVWGSITEKAADGSYIRIDDGSGTPVKVVLSGLVTPVNKPLAIGRYVGVTGFDSLAGGGTRVIRPRGNDDVDIYL